MALKRKVKYPSFVASTTDGTKQCSCCKVIKPITNFPASKNSRDRLRPYCNFCGQLVKHNITYEQYLTLLQAQSNRCSICFAMFNPNNRPHIDHDHDCCDKQFSCGKCIRGLLCFQCNNGLGAFRDSIMTLESAINYLREWK